MSAIGPTGVAVVFSLPERLRNNDAHYLFRQHSDVFYLTGFAEPDAVVVIRPGAETEKTVMFVRPRDPEMETWDGRRAGVEGAVQTYGADAAYPIAELDTRLWDVLANHEELHYALGLDERMDRRIAAAIARLRRTEKKGRRPPRAVVDPRSALHELRLHKRPEELAALRKAVAISVDAHVAVMQQGRPGVFEYELEATLDYTFRSRGGRGPGYTSIVGAGENATILHYIENRCAIAEGDLVLVDAGCEYAYYTADITRTWPASGTFSDAQRAVYERVLAVQKAAIAMVAPGVTLDEIHDFCVHELTGAMIALGLLAGTTEERVADSAYKKYYMHGTSHWLGLDVHDVGAYTRDGKPRPLEPGMVITIEPGLYIASDDAEAPERLRGIGVRIEDDVVVTEHGHEVLTSACPKEIADVEATIARAAASRAR